MARGGTGSKSGPLFIAPALLHLVVFALVPIAYALYLAFHEWKILRGDLRFVGLENFKGIFLDDRFWLSMKNTAIFVGASVPLGMIVSLAVAILVGQKMMGTAIFRTLYYIPSVTSGVAISMLWIYVFLPEKGLINATTALFGIESVDFLNSTSWAMPALIFMSIWTGLGPRMVIFLAGLVGIPPTLYEAAALDGATGWRATKHITLPMLVPTTVFVLVTSTIAAFQMFTPVYMMTKGEPDGTTEVVGYHIYQEAWVRFDIGSAAAQSVVLLLVTALVSYLQYLSMKARLEGYSAS